MNWFFRGIIGFQIILVVTLVSLVVYFGPDIAMGVLDRIDHSIDYPGSN